MAPYTDWADWAGDHPEQAEAELLREKGEPYPLSSATIVGYTLVPCEHAEVDNQGVCENCGDEVEGWEPDDAQLLTQFGTKEPMWEAMDCPDVTDDPFYADFGAKESEA